MILCRLWRVSRTSGHFIPTTCQNVSRLVGLARRCSSSCVSLPSQSTQDSNCQPALPFRALRDPFKDVDHVSGSTSQLEKPLQRSHWDGREWELTVGLEIHAQLNTERKLFSGS